MPSRVRVDPRVAVCALQAPGTQGQHARLGGVDVIDQHDDTIGIYAA